MPSSTAAAIVAFVLVAPPTTPAPPAGSGFEEAGKQVLKTVRDAFLDEQRGKAWASANATYFAGAKDEHAFSIRTNEVLSQLRTSHTRYFSPTEPGYFGLRAIFRAYLKVADVRYPSIGVDLAPGNFVRHVFVGGAADGVGLRRGDRIVSCNGKAYEPVLSLAGAPVPRRLLVERIKGRPLLEFVVTPKSVDPQEEWIEDLRRGSAILDDGRRGIAVARVFSGAGSKVEEELQGLIQDRFRTADALVVDFRDGWGGCGPTFVDLFNAATPILTSSSRRDGARTVDPHWRKPLVLLTNGGSKSGKEIVAYSLKKSGRATLVGEKTGGAVVGGSPYPLATGGLLYLAVADVRVDGERLEGVGVAPDVVVPDSLPYANDADPQLEKAIETAALLAGHPADASKPKRGRPRRASP